MQVCRIAQEALSNVLRHSRASRVDVRFGPRGRLRGLVLEVQDNGLGLGISTGVPPEQLGKGLRSMRARADVLHGELAVMDVIPHGLCIRLVLPGEELAPGAPEPVAASTL
jgi:signal transduction histidine kinase